MASINIMHKCYFCKSELSKKTNLPNNMFCRICPKTYAKNDSILWQSPCVLSFNNKYAGINKYLFFHNLKIWISLSNMNDDTIEILSIEGDLLFEINYLINIEEFTPSQLEEKIKTWMLLQ